MPDIYQLAKQFRSDLLAGESDAANAMVRAYAQVYQRIQADAAAVIDAIDQAEKSGDVPNGLASKKRRLEALRTQVLDQIHGFARFADQTISQQQRDAVYQGGEHARQLILAGMGDAPPGVTVPFNRLPTAAVENLVGTFQPGSPVTALLDTLAPQVAMQVQSVMSAGLALGKSPKTISREIRAATGEGLTRTLTISRTSTLTAYRMATLDTYRANADAVTAWRWVSGRSNRTCAACLAMDGREFPLDNCFPAHVNCRCTMVAVTRTWQELGYDISGVQSQRETGTEWLERQSDTVKEQILGTGGFKLYQGGTVTLSDFVGEKHDAKWGNSVYVRPLKEVLARLPEHA